MSVKVEKCVDVENNSNEHKNDDDVIEKDNEDEDVVVGDNNDNQLSSIGVVADGDITNIFTCHKCKKMFSTDNFLQLHIVTVHSLSLVTIKLKQYTCTSCDKSFPTKQRLGRHVAIHLVALNHYCTQCTQQFRYKTQLQKHMHNHDTINYVRSSNRIRQQPITTKCNSDIDVRKHRSIPIECNQCHKTMKNAHGLRVHMQMMHTTADGTIMHCNQCNKSMYTEQSYSRHMASVHDANESSIRCTICDKIFKSVHALHMHTSMHEIRRKLECPICGQLYRMRSHLVAHQRKSKHFDHTDVMTSSTIDHD